jgi:hypothetical protein
MRAPGSVFRASHVLVFLVIIAVLGLGIYAAILNITSPTSSTVLPFIDGLRLRQ